MACVLKKIPTRVLRFNPDSYRDASNAVHNGCFYSNRAGTFPVDNGNRLDRRMDVVFEEIESAILYPSGTQALETKKFFFNGCESVEVSLPEAGPSNVHAVPKKRVAEAAMPEAGPSNTSAAPAKRPRRAVGSRKITEFFKAKEK
jgi:hypothetical protein